MVLVVRHELIWPDLLPMIAEYSDNLTPDPLSHWGRGVPKAG